MRRMVTTKQLDYINDLQEVAEIDNSVLDVENLRVENLQVENFNFFEDIMKNYPVLSEALKNKYSSGETIESDIINFAKEVKKRGGLLFQDDYLPITYYTGDNYPYIICGYTNSVLDAGAAIAIKFDEDENKAVIIIDEI